MGVMEIKFCDLCGKRTDDLVGRLTLTRLVKRRPRGQPAWRGPATVWSRRLCKKCLNKLGILESVGDKVCEEIEMKIDEEYIKRKKLDYKRIKKLEEVIQ